MAYPEKINKNISPYSLMLVVDGKTVSVPDAMGEELYQTVRGIIKTELSRELEEVTDQAILTDDLGADSLDLVEVSMALDDEFSKDKEFEQEYPKGIPDDQIELITRVIHVRDWYNVERTKDPNLLKAWTAKRKEEIKAYSSKKYTG